MTALRVLAARIASLFAARASDARLDEEIAEHLALATEDKIARGMPPEEARLAARRSFGGVVRTTERFRETRGFPALETLAQDVRYAFRGYWKRNRCCSSRRTIRSRSPPRRCRWSRSR